MDVFPQPRVDFSNATLSINDIADDPLITVREWIEAAVAAGTKDPTAVTISTVDHQCKPDARIVLLRSVDDRGAVWFTNRDSAKGQQLSHTPFAALTWVNTELERQIRMRGHVEVLADAESDAYFATRPRKSQLAAIASQQSAPIADRATLEEAFAQIHAAYPDDTPVPRPTNWGGYLLRPEMIEFWQGRRSRMHDRVLLSRNIDTWTRLRLQP